MEKTLRKLLEKIEGFESNMYKNDFLLTWEKSDEEIKKIVFVAEVLKYMRSQNISTKCFVSLNVDENNVLKLL